MSDPEPFWSGETMLLQWGESSTRGRTITMLLPEDDDSHPFKELSTKTGKRAGQRLYAVFVLLTDSDEPDNSENLVKDAAILCRQKTFWDWAGRQFGQWIESESDARTFLCEQLSIESRSQLSTDERAASRFRMLAAQYRQTLSVFKANA